MAKIKSLSGAMGDTPPGLSPADKRRIEGADRVTRLHEPRQPARVLYGVHPTVAMTQKMVATLKEKTGRPLEQWIALMKDAGPMTENERRAWLKNVHGLGMNTAWGIASFADPEGCEFASPEAYLAAAEKYVDRMFSGAKAALHPLYQELLRLGLGIGQDVKACPCRTMVPLYRRHVFAQIKPATQTRIDLGFALGARKPEGRLIDTGGYAKKDRITHRIPISSPKDIDAEVKKWLKTAYEADGA
jgi:hypothetical protein